MSRPQIFEVMRALMERTPQALAAAEQAEAAGQPARALYFRTVAHESAVLYAWLAGDDARAALARDEQRALRRSFESLDNQLLQYRTVLREALAPEAIEAPA